MKRKRLLIVDDEKVFLKSVSDGLKPFQDTLNCDISTAANGKEAIAILDAMPIDVVVTDIRMPEADGFKLITHMINNHPGVPVVVMTAFGSQDIEKKVRELGIMRYLEKPVDFDHFLKTIEDVLALDRKEGRIEGIAISTFLQMMEMEKITCTLAISSKDKAGFFYIKNGNLVEAQCLDQTGIEAALEILSWDNVKINMKEVCKLKEGSITQTLTSILLESFRRMDSRSSSEEKEKSKTKEFLIDGKAETQADVSAGGQAIDVAKLNKVLEWLRANLGDALVSSDIFHRRKRQSLLGRNPQPKLSAAMAGLTDLFSAKLEGIGCPPLNRYALLQLADNTLVVNLPLGEYQWTIVVDGNRAQLGLLINLIIPQAIKSFGESREK